MIEFFSFTPKMANYLAAIFLLVVGACAIVDTWRNP